MRELLLVIDLQKGWLHKEATEPTFRHCIALCKQFAGDITLCMFKNDPTSLFHTQLHWTRFTDPEDTDLIPEAAALHLPTEWRTTYSCVTPENKSKLAEYDHIYIAGVYTDISVAATAMAIFDLGIPVSVVTDCVGTLHGQRVHEAALQSIDMAIGSNNMITAAALLQKQASR
jgi:nicotinamidase-related amidase